MSDTSETFERVERQDVWISPYLTAYARGAEITPADIVLAGAIEVMHNSTSVVDVDAELILEHLGTLAYNPTAERANAHTVELSVEQDEDQIIWKSLTYHNVSAESLEYGLAAVDAMGPEDRTEFATRHYEREVSLLERTVLHLQQELARMKIVDNAIHEWQPKNRPEDLIKIKVTNRVGKDSSYVRRDLADAKQELEALQGRTPQEELDGRIAGARKALHELILSAEQSEIDRVTGENRQRAEQAARLARTHDLIDTIVACVKLPEDTPESE